MPKRGIYEDTNVSEHGTWNVAADYAKTKIMEPLRLADEYELIATFGFSDFIDELNAEMGIDVLKIRGFKRLVKTIIMVINNSKFAVKKDPLDQLKKAKEELNRYWKIMPTLFKYQVNQKNKTKDLILNEEDYNKALERVIEIKSDILEPLNKYDLIFAYKEEFDPTKAKEMIKKGLKERG